MSMPNKAIQFFMAGATMLIANMGLANADGDTATGENLYRTKCRVCHSNEPGQHRVGPSLFGVVSRTCGEVPEKSFARYSPGYKAVCNSGQFSWTEDRINSYVTDPSQYLSELAGKPLRSPMTVRLSDPQDRADVIAYLKTLK